MSAHNVTQQVVESGITRKKSEIQQKERAIGKHEHEIETLKVQLDIAKGELKNLEGMKKEPLSTKNKETNAKK